jgi:hypothetical protein
MRLIGGSAVRLMASATASSRRPNIAAELVEDFKAAAD